MPDDDVATRGVGVVKESDQEFVRVLQAAGEVEEAHDVVLLWTIQAGGEAVDRAFRRRFIDPERP